MRRAATLLALLPLLACKSEEKTSSLPVVATVGANPSLGAGIEVLYDGWGVPHVYAQSDGDAAYALGYLHARDRLFEMDFYRRVARGRLAELAGSDAIPADRFFRTVFTSTQQSSKGTYRIEDVVTDGLSAEVRGVLQSYAAGVNRFLADLAAGHNGAELPVQYALVHAGPSDVAPWEIEDTVAIVRLQTWNLSSSFTGDIDAYQVFGSGMPAATFSDLTRLNPAVDSFILPAGRLGTGLVARGPAIAPAAQAGAEAVRDFLRAVPRLLPEKAASNNWVLSPGKASGHALVANDPHLSLDNPANFHLAHLVTPTRDVAGVAFPGTPAFIIGHNDKIAWGLTYVGYDVMDVYAETAASATTVVTPPGAPAQVRISETIQVRGAAPEPLSILLVPAHGPVLPGTLEKGQPLTLKWTGQANTQELRAVFDLNGARSVDEAFAAWSNFQVGAQNLVVADTAGNIGYDPHGLVPVRDPACFLAGFVPWMPMPGLAPGPAVGPCEWTGFVADADLPQAKYAPSAGRVFIATANNDINGGTQNGNPLVPGPYLYPTADPGFRHARIVERLGAKASGYTLDDMTDIQADDFSKFAQALVPGLAAWWASSDCGAEAGGPTCAGALAKKDLTAAAALLTGWDFHTPTGLSTSDPTSAALPDPAGSSAAAALFHAFVPRFARRILDDDLAAYDLEGAPLSVDRLAGLVSDYQIAKYLVALAGYAPGGTPPAIPLLTGTSLCDDVRTTGVTETCADMAILALGDAVAFLSGVSIFGSADPATWRWGRLHRVVFQSRLSQLGAPFFDYGPFAHHGGLYTVDVGNFAWNDDGSSGFWSMGGFIQHAGPNVRFSAELADGHVRWRAVIPGGQVDLPGSPHYQDQVPAWLANEKVDQPYTRAEVDAAATGRIVFTR